MFVVLCAAMAVSLPVGCQRAQIADPLTRTLPPTGDEAEFEFWHTMATRPRVSNDEAFHGLLLYVGEAQAAQDYGQRVRLLKEKQMLPMNFDRPGDEAVDRGTLAVAVARIMDVRGGLMMHVAGRRNARYALLELQDIGLFPPGRANQSFTGSEFVGIVGRTEDLRNGDSSMLPASVLAATDRSVAQAQR
jgi:hypothetical protein